MTCDITNRLEANIGPISNLHKFDVETWGLQCAYTETRLHSEVGDILYFKIIMIIIVVLSFRNNNFGDIRDFFLFWKSLTNIILTLYGYKCYEIVTILVMR